MTVGMVNAAPAPGLDGGDPLVGGADLGAGMRLAQRVPEPEARPRRVGRGNLEPGQARQIGDLQLAAVRQRVVHGKRDVADVLKDRD